MTRRFTGWVQSSALDDEWKVFWIDFEDKLLANIKRLLQAALMPDCNADFIKRKRTLVRRLRKRLLKHLIHW